MAHPDQSIDLAERRATTSETDWQFDCTVCDGVLQAGTVAEIQETGRRHLQRHDYQALSEAFAGTYGGNECQNECGYVYPASMEGIAGFTCPNCGFDHFDAFAKRYLYWHIETT